MDDNQYYAQLMRDFVKVSQGFREFLVDFEDMFEATAKRIDNGEDVFTGEGSPSGTGVVAQRITDRSSSAYRDRFFGYMKDIDEAHNRLRAEGARRLIDDLGMTLSRVAGMTDRSRQFTTRLYRQGKQRRQEAENQPQSDQ
jgi:hypothetical protein